MPAPYLVAVAALLTVAFLVSGKSRDRARFSYREVDCRTTTEVRGGDCHLVHETTGVVQNNSTEANSLGSLHLVRWWPNRRGVGLFTGDPCTIAEAGVEVALPLRFEGKSGKLLTIRWEVRLEGAIPEVAERRRYEVALRDSDGLLFDQRARLKNWHNIERLLRFSADLRVRADAGMPPLATTAVKIKLHETVFLARWLLWRIGF